MSGFSSDDDNDDDDDGDGDGDGEGDGDERMDEGGSAESRRRVPTAVHPASGDVAGHQGAAEDRSAAQAS